MRGRKAIGTEHLIVQHHLQDGSVLDDLSGYPVPVNDDTLPAYRWLLKSGVEAQGDNASEGETA